jgi:predicted nucleic-acid-binding protein
VIAVDTNVLLRMIVGDDASQMAAAEQLFQDEDIYLLSTVMLETEWVLRSRYGFDRGRIVAALKAVFALPRVSIERAATMAWAVDCYARAGDFADLVHLACVPPDVTAFASFDRKLPRGINATPVPIRVLGD